MVVLALLLVGVSMGVPRLVRAQLLSAAESALQRPVEVGAISFNLLAFRIDVTDLRVADHDGEDLFTSRQLGLDFNLASTLGGNLGFDEILVEGLSAYLSVDAEGRLNIADILETSGDDAEEGKPWDLRRLEIADARLEWVDGSEGRQFATSLGPVSFSLENFHTQRNPESPYRFEALSESGEAIRWDGTITANPLQSAGRFEIEGVELSKYGTYVSDLMPLALRSGEIEANGNYDIRRVGGRLQYELIDANLDLGKLTIEAVNNPQSRQNLNTMILRGLSWSSVARETTVDQVDLSGGLITLERTADGMSWLGMPLRGESDPSAAAAESIGRELRRFGVNQIVAQDLRVRVAGMLPADGAPWGIDFRSFQLAGLDLMNLGDRVEVEGAGTLSTGGDLSFAGSMAFGPFAPQLQIQATEVDLAGIAPMLSVSPNVSLTTGNGSLAGGLSTREGRVALTGSGAVEQLGLEGADGQPLLVARNLAWQDLELSFNPWSLRVDATTLTGAQVNLTRTANGDFPAFLSSPDQSTPEVSFTPAIAPRWEFGRIEIVDGMLTIKDESALFPARLNFAEISGRADDWDSRSSEAGAIALRAQTGEDASISVQGDWNPLADASPLDLTVRIDDLDMRMLSGYVARYLGYEAAQGSFSVEADWQSSRQEVEGEIRARVKGLKLGSKVKSPDATSLPVPLALRLLKNRDDEIRLELPISGQREDPAFGVGRAVGRAIQAKLQEVVTSPLSLLSPPGGEVDEDKFKQFGFAPGDTLLTAESRQNLGLLSEWLVDRPEMKVAITGGVSEARDWEFLRPQSLELLLRRRASHQEFLPATGWLPHARESALVSLFQEVFGEPPVDMSAELPPMPPPIESAPEISLEPGDIEQVESRSLLAWLRVVFGPRRSTVAEESNEPILPPGAILAPEGMQAELPALPVEEITRRLLPEILVDPALARDLARDRAEAVKEQLIANGVRADQLILLEPIGSEAVVTLDLR
ncbi:MAG: hypothetical protein SynsKO_36190 [Synoicihabitans sp.]